MAELTGYIKLYRDFLNFEWIDQPNTVSLFIYLIVAANWTDKEWHGVFIKRGQILTSRRKLAQTLGMTEQSVRTALKHLLSTGQITIISTKRGMLINVENYTKHQAHTRKNNPQNTHDATQCQPTPNQPLTTTKEDKEDKEEINISISNSVAEVLSDGDYEILENWYGEENTIRIIDMVDDAFAGRSIGELKHPLQYCIKLADKTFGRRNDANYSD